MDLSKTPNDKKLFLCRWYFRTGFALLPFLWAVNAVWFYRPAFTEPPFEEQKQIRKYVILSAIGALLFSALFATWIAIFSTHRSAWGEFGDSISFVIPTGVP